MGQSSRSGCRVGAAMFIAVAVAALLAWPAAAFAAAATFSAKAPAAASSTTAARPKTKITVYDKAGVKGASSYSMTIDGSKVKPSISYAKRGDYRRFTLSYKPVIDGLNGAHSVVVTVRNRRGVSSKVSWTYTIAVPVPDSVGTMLAAAVPVVPPTGSSDLQPSYVGTATIHLLPAPGQRTFYSLDGGRIVEGATLVVAAPASGTAAHSLNFMFLDAAGNAEIPMTAVFSVSAVPVAPPADVTPPVTTSDARTSYDGTATVSLSVTDDRAGVCRTFWRLDGGPVHEGTTIVVPAPEEQIATHSLEFWSVDAAGNEEAHQVVAFSVEPVLVIPIIPPHIANGPCVASGCHIANVATLHGSTGCPDCHGSGVTATFDCESCHDDAEIAANHDLVPPHTTSDAKPFYVGDARIALYPMDGSPFPHPSVIGWNIATICYTLDGGPVIEVPGTLGTGPIVTVPAPAPGMPSADHELEFWSTDLVGNVEWQHTTVAFTVEPETPRDVTPPATTARVSEGLLTGSGAYAGDVVITLSANDAGSGVAETLWSMDGASAHSGTRVPVEAPTVGRFFHYLEYWSVDNAGNREDHKTFMVIVDPTPPADPAHAAPNTMFVLTEGLSILGPNTYAGPETIELRVFTPGTAGSPRTYYRLDGAPAVEATSLSIPAPATGIDSHTLVYWSVDAAGNRETDKVNSFTIHPTPAEWLARTIMPTTTFTGPEGFVGPASIPLVASDPGGPGILHTYYRLDGGPRMEGICVSIPAPATGAVTHTVEYWSQDTAYQPELPHKQATFEVQAYPPIVIDPPTSPIWDLQPSYVATAVIRIFPPAGSTARWRLDGGATVTGTMVVVSAPASGTAPHTLTITFTDAAGNVLSTKTGTFQVSAGADTVPPVTTSNARNSYVGTATVTFSVAENSSAPTHTFYKLDGGQTIEGMSVVVPAPASGIAAHVLEFWSVDNARNEETPHKTAHFTVEYNAPVSIPTPPGQIVSPYTDLHSSYTGQATIHMFPPTGGAIYSRIDSGAQTTSTSLVVAPPASGTAMHTLTFTVVDAAGNASMAQTAAFSVSAASAGVS
jgi:hypothetical protein